MKKVPKDRRIHLYASLIYDILRYHQYQDHPPHPVQEVPPWLLVSALPFGQLPQNWNRPPVDKMYKSK